MPDLSLIMLGAGSSTRFQISAKKQWLRIGDMPLWLYATTNFTKHFDFHKIIIVSSHQELEYMKLFSKDFTFIEGGASRSESLQNALSLVQTQKVLVSDVARARVPKEMIERILAPNDSHLCVVPYLSVSDTVVYGSQTIDREQIKRIQTPQRSDTQTLKAALAQAGDFTDESSAIKAMGHDITYVLGDTKAHKITNIDDLGILGDLAGPSRDIFTGFGYDVHAFELGVAMWLGGVCIDDPRGFRAHSDGDVALHALIDALLGAVGAGDIGEWFPDNDAKFANIDSKELLARVLTFIKSIGFEIINCDITIQAQSPKLSPYKALMRETIAELLGINQPRVNIKATTTEKLGFIGRQEGVAVSAVANLKYYDWKRK